jgi:diadenosine tetraphosphate (Ap4A) HIT family hydrolase
VPAESGKNESVTSSFVLDPRLMADTERLAASDLSVLLLMNERRYPWLILVPKRPGLTELFELDPYERGLLMEESCAVAQVLRDVFSAYKVNVGALGNVVRQLHVHHVARNPGDPAWPGPVWGHSAREAYDTEELSRMRNIARAALGTTFDFDAFD